MVPHIRTFLYPLCATPLPSSFSPTLPPSYPPSIISLSPPSPPLYLTPLTFSPLTPKNSDHFLDFSEFFKLFHSLMKHQKKIRRDAKKEELDRGDSIITAAQAASKSKGKHHHRHHKKKKHRDKDKKKKKKKKKSKRAVTPERNQSIWGGECTHSLSPCTHTCTHTHMHTHPQPSHHSRTDDPTGRYRHERTASPRRWSAGQSSSCCCCCCDHQVTQNARDRKHALYGTQTTQKSTREGFLSRVRSAAHRPPGATGRW